MKDNQKYPGCWWCDNLIDHAGQTGLLHLGFPRCFVLLRDSSEFYFSDYDHFISHISEVNWLDPSDKGTPEEQERVLTMLWNFSVEQEEEEERMGEEYMDEEDF